jgi:hypothetical protein
VAPTTSAAAAIIEAILKSIFELIVIGIVL